MNHTRRPQFLLLLVLLLLATACGGSDDDGGQSAAAAATITISNLEFSPQILTVQVGDTVTVENKDDTEHTVTATDKSFDTGPFTGTKTFTVSKAGRFEYLCEIHPAMTHRVIVVG